MRVSVLGFGSVWRHRFGRPDDPERFLRAAYYNTTGVMVQGKVRTRPKIIGHVRLNGTGGFNPNYPQRMIHEVFECEEPCVWQGQNKVLFKHVLDVPVRPDRYLVVVRPTDVGRLNICAPDWKSADTWLISFSECREEQEAMLLMPPHGWLRTALGQFSLRPLPMRPWRARLELQVAHEEDEADALQQRINSSEPVPGPPAAAADPALPVRDPEPVVRVHAAGPPRT